MERARQLQNVCKLQSIWPVWRTLNGVTSPVGVTLRMPQLKLCGSHKIVEHSRYRRQRES